MPLGSPNNSSENWLGDTVTGVDGASHHAPSITFVSILLYDGNSVIVNSDFNVNVSELLFMTSYHIRDSVQQHGSKINLIIA